MEKKEDKNITATAPQKRKEEGEGELLPSPPSSHPPSFNLQISLAPPLLPPALSNFSCAFSRVLVASPAPFAASPPGLPLVADLISGRASLFVPLIFLQPSSPAPFPLATSSSSHCAPLSISLLLSAPARPPGRALVAVSAMRQLLLQPPRDLLTMQASAPTTPPGRDLLAISADNASNRRHLSLADLTSPYQSAAPTSSSRAPPPGRTPPAASPSLGGASSLQAELLQPSSYNCAPPLKPCSYNCLPPCLATDLISGAISSLWTSCFPRLMSVSSRLSFVSQASGLSSLLLINLRRVLFP